MNPDPLRVVIVDDQRVVRDGLTMLVGLIDGLDVVGAAADGAEAVALSDREHPDVVLMDLRMPHMDGAEATRLIRSGSPTTQVLVLTTYADDESLFPALQAGARGYLTKDASADQIRAAVEAVARGEAALDPAVQHHVIAALSGPAPAEPSPDLPDGLTPREVEVLALIAEGLTNAEIAGRLVVSGATVKTHVNHIFAKTGARDRAHAVVYAYAHGLAAGSS
jgi:DNA-binding NarL/FixJ family response regulator